MRKRRPCNNSWGTPTLKKKSKKEEIAKEIERFKEKQSEES